MKEQTDGFIEKCFEHYGKTFEKRRSFQTNGNDKETVARNKKKKQLKLFWAHNEKSRLGEADTEMEHQRIAAMSLCNRIET